MVVPRKPGIVECRRERLRPATVALIEPHRVPSGRECALGKSPHVSGFARPFKPVDEHQGRAFARLRLPVAFAPNARAGFGFKFPRTASREAGKSSRPERRGKRLCMWIAQQGMWVESLHSQIILRHATDCNTPKHGTSPKMWSGGVAGIGPVSDRTASHALSK
jgi:hypothetical protein